MDKETIILLNTLNEKFYCENGVSFDQSRQGAWPGWNRVVEHLAYIHTDRVLGVLDVACGNMRFEKYLEDALPDVEFNATCVDSCDNLAVDLKHCKYHHMDVVNELMKSPSLASAWGYGFDLVVSFGFLHHVPSGKLRMRLLESMIDVAKPGGLIAVSLWRFASDSKLLAKADRTTAKALAVLPTTPRLDEGDFLLGWNDVPGAFRYCHSFDDCEIDSIASASSHDSDCIDRFRADGRNNMLNEYLVLRKR